MKYKELFEMDLIEKKIDNEVKLAKDVVFKDIEITSEAYGQVCSMLANEMNKISNSNDLTSWYKQKSERYVYLRVLSKKYFKFMQEMNKLIVKDKSIRRLDDAVQRQLSFRRMVKLAKPKADKIFKEILKTAPKYIEPSKVK